VTTMEKLLRVVSVLFFISIARGRIFDFLSISESLVFVLLEVSSLKCHVCSSLDNSACGDPFTGNGTLVECPISPPIIGKMEPTVCRKLKQSSRFDRP
jgi:hypothetical protein